MTSLPPLPSIVPPVPLPTIGDRPGFTNPIAPAAPPEKPSVTNVPMPEERPNVTSLATEAHEALLGIPADITSGRGTMYEIVTRGNRLRGLGFILVCFALFAALLGLLR